ncbi:mechanosensitive ion channel family protein [Paraferrimonas sedimenticola]|uniref:Small-conductance mechanosensitive channel n=1 Tax=Paraferrimonas sedimenticola TaxID=375674 RepID=A0AA37RWE0_9GAMM|nr:mechanosensitive ion channel family protein [Paraferrimonas sedimenticola]GLP96293.1 mechanosensitive ion channel protein MscS [Paraferrimonas sedimenticola]
MTATTVILLVAVIIGFVLSNRALRALVLRVGLERDIPEARVDYVLKSLQVLLLFVAAIAALAATGRGLQDVGLLLGSSLAFIGIGLFAHWSLLSNATASIIVFFFFPYGAGDWVRIIEGENSVIGKIREITLFHVILVDDEGDVYTYPNAMVFQKAVQISKQKIVAKPKVLAATKEDKLP